MRRLVVLRHATSPWSPGVADRDRPLDQAGHDQAQAMGSWLHSQGLVPDYTVASPALRARQTALAAGAAWDLDASAVQWREGVYNADLATLLGVLADAHPTAATTLLVGHNPGLSDLVNHLDRPEYAHGRISLQPGAAAILELPNGWSKLAPGCGRLVLVQQPATTP